MVKEEALRNHSTGISRVYVVCAENTNRVIGYYCLSSGSVHRNTVLGPIDATRLMSFQSLFWDGLPSTSWAGNGLGAALLKDAIYRTQNIAFQVGVRALAVHALNEEVKCFTPV